MPDHVCVAEMGWVFVAYISGCLTGGALMTYWCDKELKQIQAELDLLKAEEMKKYECDNSSPI